MRLNDRGTASRQAVSSIAWSPPIATLPAREQLPPIRYESLGLGGHPNMDPNSGTAYDPRHQYPSSTSAPISHPYPPNHRSRTSDRTSQSYAYDQARRPPPNSQSHQSFSDTTDPYNPRSSPNNTTAGQRGIGGHDKEDTLDSVNASSVKTARGPKIGKGVYAEHWTKEDEEAERLYLQEGMFKWRELVKWRYWVRASWWYWYIIIIVVCVLVALMTIYNDQIVEWLTPVANWMKALPAGYTIPVAVLFVLSFPPLFGQEIVILLVGAVWGLWVGFAITTVGTLLGEIGNFYAFKYCLRGRALKLEETNPNYACLAHIVREGGFFLIFVIRLSAVPGHFSTAVFATCGMNIFIFVLATLLTMPKQLVIVYLGVIFADSGTKSKEERIITYSTLAVAFVLTIWSAWYIYKKMNKARTVIWRRERLAQKAAILANGGPIDVAQVNRRISYKAMLDQPNDDIEALSPMLPKHQGYGFSAQNRQNGLAANNMEMRQAYGTPYETQQVYSLSHIKESSSSSNTSSETTIDVSLPPPSYQSPLPISPVNVSRHTFGSARPDSTTIPTRPQADLSSSNNNSSYDLDGPEVRENRIDFGYNPNASTEVFPTPQPRLGVKDQRRISDYDSSVEQVYEGEYGRAGQRLDQQDGGKYDDGRHRGGGTGGMV